MAKQRHLSKAPITEALMDFRVTLPPETRRIEHLAALGEKYKDLYPEKKDIHEFAYKVEFGASDKDEKSSKHLGFRFANAQNTQVIQATLGGLTFSRLHPYQEWSKLRDEAKRVWQGYAEHVRPENITRLAVRYINKLSLPGPHVDFDDYLNYAPVVPKALPQSLGGFFSRIIVPDAKGECTAIITQQFQPSEKLSEIAVILDIDAFREKVFADEREMWETFEALKNFKNLIFFDSITEKCAKLFL
jgi:uncharacterized protein (TIGR04255 family)